MSAEIPVFLYRTEQVRAAELHMLAAEQIGETELLARAGEAAADLALMRHPNALRVTVLAGNGKNGADALVVARLLRRKGIDVTVMSLNAAKFAKEYINAKLALESEGGRVIPMEPESLDSAAIIIDGLIGTGLISALREEMTQVVDTINASNAWVLSLDVPSGIDADTGYCHGVAVEADLTLVFGAIKQGLLTSRARHCCGEIAFADLGLTPYLPEPAAMRADVRCLPHWFGSRPRDSHKGMSGKVTVIGGDFGMPGAVRLAAEACMRSGAGMVTVISRPEHQMSVIVNRPELMFLGCDLVDMEVYQKLGWADVLVLGPGLGKRDWGYNLFKSVGLSDKPKVLDADALNILSGEPRHQSNWVLTPHPGEAARLLGVGIEEIEQDRFSAVKALQAKYGGLVLLKGAGTLIYDGETLTVAPVGNPGLASGGSGDVLSGILGALMAQGLDNAKATIAAVVIHGMAADLAAQQGERGMLAGDLMPFIRQLVNSDLS
jgi:ADP-dependent NAD(P)H-hydrate dehydratase / NAD(P)H-hydrate epimerase